MTDPIPLIPSLTLRMRQSQTEGCARSWARHLVQAKLEAGEYGPLRFVTEELFEALVVVEMRNADR